MSSRGDIEKSPQNFFKTNSLNLDATKLAEDYRENSC